MERRTFIGLLGLCTLLPLSAGCTPLPTQESPSSAPLQPESKSYEFAFVCPVIQNEYWQRCIDGIAHADADFGTHTQVVGPQETADFAVEIVNSMEAALALRPDGILAYIGIEDLAPLIQAAADLGIPVLALDSDAPDTPRIAYVGTDSYNCGYRAGEEMVRLTDGTAKIGLLMSSFSADKEQAVIDAFKDCIADYDMEIVAWEQTDADPQVAAEKTVEMLEEHPDITAMFNTGGLNVAGAARAKKALGCDDLVLIGFDDIEENLRYIREGVIDVIFAQAPGQMGYRGVQLLKEYLDKGRLSRDTYDTGAIRVTMENVDSYQE